ncbi:hypothetical protein CAS74_002430 [Pichia kudriavzevii]|uniref:B30.2/SPRY domain-containing protein n=1 Tax=Pichia kudriavzevii TaxID=4909 RepID=A0A1Z8JQ15_PICKU|nr:hypothetical protein CAS74_002430 [Pichia kudriavzevii]
MAKKQKVIPRLKPTPYELNDLITTLKQPQLVPSAKLYTKDCDTIQLYTTPDLPNNKRGFKYTPCRPNPFLDSSLYSTTDLPPFTAHWSYFDRSPDILVDEDMAIVGCQEGDGWRSVRAEYGLREKRWYIEYEIISGIPKVGGDESINNNADSRSHTPVIEAGSSVAHVRVGIARREASLEAPVGFDGYGYGIRDINCEKVHLSRRGDIGTKRDLKIGDIIGILIELPDIQTQKEISKAMIYEKTLEEPQKLDPALDSKNINDSFIGKGVEREMIPIKYKNNLYFEEYEYTGSKQMDHLLNPVTVFGEHAMPDNKRSQPAKLPNSSMTLYINGEKVGVPFTNLIAFLPPASEQRAARDQKSKKQLDDFIVDRDDGTLGYYPMVSCFRGGAVKLNTSSKVWRVPQDLDSALNSGAIKPYGLRMHSSIVEQTVYDLIEDAVNKYLDRKERDFLAEKL